MNRPNASYPSNDSCPFCKIIQGQTPSHPVYEDDLSIAFLDARPLLRGHCLLVPKEHVETLIDLPDRLIGPLFTNARRLARAVEEGLGADGSFLAINNKISQSIPHLHVHVVPRWKKDGLFSKILIWRRRPYQNDAMIVETQRAIRSAIQKIFSEE